MTRNSLRRFIGCAGLSVGAMALAGADRAAAQDTTPDLPRERTGPLATPPPQPDFATPPPRPDAPTAIPPVSAPHNLQAVTFSDIQVTQQGEGVARPDPDWKPTADAAAAVHLEHQPGQALDPEWIRRQFAANGMIGAPTSYSRVVALTQAINRAFLQNGYANSGVLIPPQADGASGGVLALNLVLGRVGGEGAGPGGVTVAWLNDRRAGLSDRYITARMPSAAARPLSVFAIESDFRLLADDPAIRTIDASLRPGARPGEADLLLTVNPQRRFDVYLAAANNRSPAVGGTRLSIGGSARNMLLGGDVLSGEFGNTDGLKDVVVGYTGPVLGPRTDLILRGAYNDAAVVEPLLVPLDIRSREWSAEGGFSHTLSERPLMPDDGRWRSARSLSAGALVAHRKTRTQLLGEPFSFSPGSVNGRAEYTALRLTQDFVERGISHVFAVSLTETIGLEGTRSRLPGALNPDKNFMTLLAQVSYAQRLADKLELNMRVAGQYSSGTLYSGERFSVGGQNGVRGYRENLLLADRGLLGSVELGYSFSLTGGRTNQAGFDWGAFRVAAFSDAAVVGNARPPSPLPKWIASVGGSLTWKPSEAIFARATYGEALRSARINGERDLQDKGFQFFVTVRPLLLF